MSTVPSGVRPAMAPGPTPAALEHPARASSARPTSRRRNSATRFVMQGPFRSDPTSNRYDRLEPTLGRGLDEDGKNLAPSTTAPADVMLGLFMSPPGCFRSQTTTSS